MNENMQSDAKDFRLGILFVHGIGLQPPGETLISWGDILLNTIRRVTGGKVSGIIEHGKLGGKSWDNPAEIEVKIQLEENKEESNEKWLITEGWWADSFPAPTYKELVSWSFRAVPWVLATHISHRYRQEKSLDKFWALGKAIFQLFLFTLFLAPMIMFLLGGILLLGSLPISNLRKTLLSIQSTLTGTVGDSLVFAESPVRASFIKTQILQGLKRLKEKCEHTIVLAHSQGAAVALDTLGGIEVLEGKSKSQRTHLNQADALMPDTLVTFGSGVSKLASLKQFASDRIINTSKVDPARTAVIYILIAAVFFGIMFYQLRVQSLSYMGILITIGIYVAPILIAFLVIKLKRKRHDKAELKGPLSSDTKKEAGIKPNDSKSLKLWPFVFGILGLIILLMVGSRFELISLPLFFLILALTLWLASIYLILKDPSTGNVKKPDHLECWVDIYASDDPVSNGKTLVDNESSFQSLKIWNYGSMISDHTSYWNNLTVSSYALRGYVLKPPGVDGRINSHTRISTWIFGQPGGSNY